MFDLVAGLRLLAPDDLGIRDQTRPTSYMLDTVQNHNWLWPRDANEALGSKPPLHPLMGALAGHVLGEVNRAARIFPSLLGMLATVLALYFVGRERIGWRAGFWAATALLLSPIGVKLVALVRTDALFGCVVFLNAMAMLRVWERGKGWGTFWLVSFVTTMVKVRSA